MASQPTPIQIPLMEISGMVDQEAPAGEFPQGLKRISVMEIPASQVLPNSCYVLELPDIIRESAESRNSLGIFGSGEDIAALNDIYVLGLTGREPVVCKVVKNDARSGSSNQGDSAVSPPRVKNRRKSFMTPTPLHIPESRVSPIPDSAHEMIYLKGLNENETLQVVPLRDVVWMHPLISMVENLRK